MEVVISKIYLTKVPFFVKINVFGVNNKVQKGKEKVQRPQNRFFSKGGGQILKVVGKF